MKDNIIKKKNILNEEQLAKAIDEKTADISLQLDNIENTKMNKTDILSMANIGQDIKEAMTGGSVAVVGENSILEENIVDKQVTFKKLAYELQCSILTNTTLKDLYYSIFGDYNLELGAISSSTGQDSAVTTNLRVRSGFIFLSSDCELINELNSDLSATIFVYDRFKNFEYSTSFLGWYENADDKYIRLVFGSTGGEMSGRFADIKNGLKYKRKRRIKNIKFELGNLSSNGGADSVVSSNNRCRTKLIKVNKNDIIVNEDVINYKYRIFKYDEFKKFNIDGDYILDSSHSIDFNGYIRLVAVKNNDLNLDITDLRNLAFNIKIKSNAVENENGNVLYNKTLLNFGDSIALGGYAQIIANKNYMNLHNMAVGGATIALVSGQPNILTQINTAKGNNIDCDYILFNGGTNDAIEERTTLGVITESYEGGYDISTFSGAFELTCQRLKLNWIGKKIIYVRVHKMDSRGELQSIYGDRAIEICKKWSIPYVDIYNEGGLNSFIPEYKKQYTNATSEKPDGDGTHPNGEGYNVFYVPQIESKMRNI